MVEVTFEEHQADLAKELETIGLLEAVMKRLSEINVTTIVRAVIKGINLLIHLRNVL